MFQWVSVQSERIVSAAYDPEQQVILVEFPNGVRWWYGGCTPETWQEFMDPLTSKGRFIKDILDGHQNGRYDG